MYRRAPTPVHRRPALDEQGAEALELALVAPVLLLLVLGTVWALVVAAAQVSLQHAASAGARYASIPTDMVRGTYPDATAVGARVEAATPFFAPGTCTTTVDGPTAQNAPVVVEVRCPFPNPLGRVLGPLVGSSQTAGAFADSVVLSARAEARRE